MRVDAERRPLENWVRRLGDEGTKGNDMTQEKLLALADEAGLWYPMGGSPDALHGRARLVEFARLIEAAERERMRAALVTAEAALADIGDADREPSDDMAWCERRAARALPAVRAALMLHVVADPVTTVARHALRGPNGEVVKTALTPNV